MRKQREGIRREVKATKQEKSNTEEIADNSKNIRRTFRGEVELIV